MYTKTYSCCRHGIDADLIHVEIDSSKGLPGFNIVGLADKSINEAKERISVAMQACDFELPPNRILVNLSPAHIKKEGSHFDLAIAAGLMANFGFADISETLLKDFVFFSELSLDGKLCFSTNLLILALSKNIKAKYFVVSKANKKDAEVIQAIYKDKKKVFLAEDLRDLKVILETISSLGSSISETEKASFKKILEYFSIIKPDLNSRGPVNLNNLNFADVLGQSLAKRAFEIAVAGNHHLLMIGPPGCGKTMLANRFITLLPELKLEQALQTTKIHNAHGYSTDGLIKAAPLRKPHHSLSAAAFVGGGKDKVKPGEVSLAHNGVLFLDEMTEFSKFTLNQLRQILEEKSITIRRVNDSQKFPADFLLLAACNPCPCGYLGDTETNCRCTQNQIERYLGKLSGPLLDRIDIHLRLTKLSPETLRLFGKKEFSNKKYSTETMMENIQAAKIFMKNDNQSLELKAKQEDFMEKAIYNFKLSARSHQKIIRLARTIANFDKSSYIQESHLSEALQFRAVNWSNYS